MEHPGWLRDALIFLTAAVVLLPLVQRLKSTSILGFLMVGIVIGPHGLALIERSHDIRQLGELGVVFLLFVIGLELSMTRLKTLGRYVFGLGGLQVCLTAAVLDVILVRLGLPLPAALILGGALSLSSTAFVTEMLMERNELMSRHGRVAFAVLLLQDIAVVPMLVFQEFLDDAATGMAEAFLSAALSGLLAVILVILVGRFVLRPVFSMVARTSNPDLFVAVTLLVILGSGWMLMLGGLSMAMGAFLCGVLLAESEFRHQIEADIRPFKGLLLGLFFATVGMSLDLGTLAEHARVVLACVLGLVVLKSAILCILCRLFGTVWRDSVRVGLLLGQGGEFAFVILGAAGEAVLIDSLTLQLAMDVVGISMVLTPLLDWVGRRIPDAASGNKVPDRDSAFVLIAGFGRVGQTVAKALAETGVAMIAVDHDARRVEVCRKLGLDVYFGNAARPGVLEKAGAAEAMAVVVALDNQRAATAVLNVLTQSGVETPVIARSRDLCYRSVLENAGATAVVPDTVEASLRLAEVVLGSVGISQDETRESLERLRVDDYALLEHPLGIRRES